MMALRQVNNPTNLAPALIGARKVQLDRRPRVLCATDLSSRSKVAVGRAHAIAQSLGGQLLLLHVLSAAKSLRGIRGRGARARARAAFSLDAQARKLARIGNAAQIAVRAGPAHKAIADVAIEWDADLIVLGPYRRRFGDGLWGAMAERVMRRADRPVLVVNRRPSGPYEHVLLTSDLSNMASGIATVASEFGLLESSRASVVHAQQRSRTMLYLAGVSESEVDGVRRSLRESASDEVKMHLSGAGLDSARFSVLSLETWPLRGIEEAAERTGSDLVVVGSSRFPVFKRVFIGSVSNGVLRGAEHDVLLISPAAVRRARGRAATSAHALHSRRAPAAPLSAMVGGCCPQPRDRQPRVGWRARGCLEDASSSSLRTTA